MTVLDFCRGEFIGCTLLMMNQLKRSMENGTRDSKTNASDVLDDLRAWALDEICCRHETCQIRSFGCAVSQAAWLPPGFTTANTNPPYLNCLFQVRAPRQLAAAGMHKNDSDSG
jgi:hypothetical protein